MIRKIIIALVLLAVILLPYLIFHNDVKFAPYILLNAWYKTLFITGIIGLFYKYVVEKKISDINNSSLRKKEIGIILNKLEFVKNSFTDDPLLASENVKAIKIIIETSTNNYIYLYEIVSKLLESIDSYSENPGGEKRRQEMEHQIEFKISKIIEKANNSK